MSDVITLHVDEPQPITLDYIEAKIKPETVGHATPTEQAQTVTPAPGTTFSAVEVDAIPPEYIKPTGTIGITENGETDVREFESALVAVPQPSGKITITENGTGLDIADYAEADVNVQPNLQTPNPITPTKQQQTITPSAGYDGLAQAVVEPIPSEYIVPAGKITLTENDTDVDVSQYAKADIAVPVPVMPEEYAIGGSIVDGTATGYYIKNGVEEIDSAHLKNLPLLEFISMPDSIRHIRTQAFFQNIKLNITDLPPSLETIEDYAFFACSAIKQIIFHSVPTTLTSRAFSTAANLRNIYVPWSEGEVANAPWGATNATIHYNYTGGN